VVYTNNGSIIRNIAKTISPWLVFFVLASTTIASVVRAESSASTSTRLKTGMDFSSGDYGLQEDTEMLYIPVTLSYETLPWLVSITVPYLRIDGPGGIIGGGDGGAIVRPGSGQGGGGDGGQGHGHGHGHGNGPGNGHEKPTEGHISEQGLGDVIIRASYALDTLMDTSSLVDVTAKVKLATADEERELGTGKNDYSLQLDVARTIGKFTPYGSLGYKFMGNPDEYDLDNIWFASAGFDYRLNPAVTLGTAIDLREATSSSTEGMKEWMAYLNWKPAKSWSINGYGVAGFSDGSPDTAVGIQVTYHH